MAGLADRVEKIKAFLNRDVWEIDTRALPPWRACLVRLAQLVSVVVRDFFADHCLIRASALTYTTLLSIVPLLALMFSVLKGFGVQNTLEPIILEHLAIGSEVIVSQIINYINNTNFGRLGTVGLVLLIVTVLALLSNIERSFNHIWGVVETRSLYRRFADYLSVLLIGPLFLLAAVSMTTSLQNQSLVQRLMETTVIGDALLIVFKVVPFVIMWAAFTCLYLFMTNTKVKLGAAVAGGILGGTLWQLCQWVYVDFQIGVARYNAIYGTMAALPIFMVWLYLSWLTVLLGLEMAHAWQNLRVIRLERSMAPVNYAGRECAAISLLLRAAEAFYRAQKPKSCEAFAEDLGLPPRLVRGTVSDLVRLGFLAEVSPGGAAEVAYQPGCEPETLEIATVLRVLREDGVDCSTPRWSSEYEVVLQLEEKLRQAGELALNGMTLGDLVRKTADAAAAAGTSPAVE